MSETLSLDEIEAIKTKQQATWASGNYSVIGTTLQLVGESLCETIDAPAGAKVLDVAAGNGNATLAAARRGAEVTSTDYVPELLADGQARAQAEGLAVTSEVADAEALPYADDSFDVVVSTFGVMFVPNPPRAAAEMLRVVKPGGKIGLANWHPDGFVGGMFKIIGGLVPPPAGITSPMQWGVEAKLQELFAGADVQVTVKRFTFRYRSAQHMFEAFRDYYGPTVKAWAALDDEGKAAFEEQLVAHMDAGNRRTDGTLAVDSDYVEVIVTQR